MTDLTDTKAQGHIQPPEWHLSNLLRFICPDPKNLRGLRDDDGMSMEVHLRVGDVRDAHALVASCFGSDGKEQDRWCEDMDNRCPHCGGSGHKDDIRPDTIQTVTLTEAEQAAFESGRSIGMAEAAKIARDWWDGCEAETPHQLIDQAIRALSMPAPTRQEGGETNTKNFDIAQAGWLPIETAPRDGTEFLGSGFTWGDEEEDFTTERFMAVVSWDFSENCWVSDENPVHPLTHWQPLPAPPQPTEAPHDPR